MAILDVNACGKETWLMSLYTKAVRAQKRFTEEKPAFPPHSNGFLGLYRALLQPMTKVFAYLI